MAKTIRNKFDEVLTYEKLQEAHRLCQTCKTSKPEIILFNLKKEEYLKWLYEQLKSGNYRHGGYRIFYLTKPKRRKVQVSRYIDRIVHRWVVDNFLKEYFIKNFIYHSYACIEGKGMHNAVLAVQKAMKHCNRTWGEYYMLKMDVAKYFQSIDICQYIFKRNRQIHKIRTQMQILFQIHGRFINNRKNKKRSSRNTRKNKEILRRKTKIKSKLQNTNNKKQTRSKFLWI